MAKEVQNYNNGREEEEDNIEEEYKYRRK